MRHLTYSDLQVEAMIKLRYGRLVTDDNHPSFVSYGTIGRLFKCSASKVRQLIMDKFEMHRRQTLPLLEQMKLQ